MQRSARSAAEARFSMSALPAPTMVTVRTSRPEDVPAITAIYAHAVRHGRATFELEPPDEIEMATRRAALLAARFPYVVAEGCGLVAGYAYASAYRPRPAYACTVEGSVWASAWPGRCGRWAGSTSAGSTPC
jgi:L-amino acid N-acyltransferase YncA